MDRIVDLHDKYLMAEEKFMDKIGDLTGISLGKVDMHRWCYTVDLYFDRIEEDTIDESYRDNVSNQIRDFLKEEGFVFFWVHFHYSYDKCEPLCTARCILANS